jgi:PTH1 family peptidyl-tRNA hydrolase
MGEGFKRVRLGIGHPGSKDQVLGHVLGNFSSLDGWVEPLLEAMAKNADLLLSHQDASFQNKVALAMQAWKKSCAEPPSGSA